MIDKVNINPLRRKPSPGWIAIGILAAIGVIHAHPVATIIVAVLAGIAFAAWAAVRRIRKLADRAFGR